MGATLVYKRTHHGDPDSLGRFGCHDCMGRVRRWKFDAVIGIGGCGREAVASDIAEKLNWIGIGPQVVGRRGRGPILAFEQFIDYGTGGPNVWDVAPHLAIRMYGGGVRATLWFNQRAEEEIEELLARARGNPPSRILTMASRSVRRCRHHMKCRSTTSDVCFRRTRGLVL